MDDAADRLAFGRAASVGEPAAGRGSAGHDSTGTVMAGVGLAQGELYCRPVRAAELRCRFLGSVRAGEEDARYDRPT